MGVGHNPDSVHPRACGEHTFARMGVPSAFGSSPRLRGTLWLAGCMDSSFRFIPAPAGNTLTLCSRSALKTVHPRACGEHPTTPVYHSGVIGSSPRLRGTLRGGQGSGLHGRFIPAPAGNTALGGQYVRRQSVHPRACGEHEMTVPQGMTVNGSSPRLRGTRRYLHCHYILGRFIPAPAGNTPSSYLRDMTETVHPRACGEHALDLYGNDLDFGSSPRLRGTPRNIHRRRSGKRFIPAPAGNTTTPTEKSGRATVHPRACGEHARAHEGVKDFIGSSPRLRGTLSLKGS